MEKFVQQYIFGWEYERDCNLVSVYVNTEVDYNLLISVHFWADGSFKYLLGPLTFTAVENDQLPAALCSLLICSLLIVEEESADSLHS